MSFLSTIFAKKPIGITEPLYTALVEWGRDPWFYTTAKVPDTIDGRFDMISLMVSLVLIRLEREGDAVQGFGQRLIETFITDMDRSMREIGVGDLSVGKHVQRMAEAFLGRLGAYRTALMAEAEPEALAHAVARNVYRNDKAETLPLTIKIKLILAYLATRDPSDVAHGKLGLLP